MKTSKWTQQQYAQFKGEVDTATRNTTSPRRCYSCIEANCLANRRAAHIKKGGDKPAVGKEYREWRSKLDKNKKCIMETTPTAQPQEESTKAILIGPNLVIVNTEKQEETEAEGTTQEAINADLEQQREKTERLKRELMTEKVKTEKLKKDLC